MNRTLSAGLLALAVTRGTTVTAQEEPAAGGGLHLYPVTPCRIMDTRQGHQGGPLVTNTAVPNGSSGSRTFTVALAAASATRQA